MFWFLLFLCLVIFGASCLIFALFATPAALVAGLTAFGIGWWASGEITRP